MEKGSWKFEFVSVGNQQVIFKNYHEFYDGIRWSFDTVFQDDVNNDFQRQLFTQVSNPLEIS